MEFGMNEFIVYITGYISMFLLVGWFVRHSISDWGGFTYWQIMLVAITSWLGIFAFSIMFVIALIFSVCYYLWFGFTKIPVVSFLGKSPTKRS